MPTQLVSAQILTMTTKPVNNRTHQLKLLRDAHHLRKKMEELGYRVESTSIKEEVREDRLDDLMNWAEFREQMSSTRSEVQ